jgi:hypothetical protein
MNRETARTDFVPPTRLDSTLTVAVMVYGIAAGVAIVAMVAALVFGSGPLAAPYTWGVRMLFVCLGLAVVGAAVRVVEELSSATERTLVGMLALVLLGALAALDLLASLIVD